MRALGQETAETAENCNHLFLNDVKNKKILGGLGGLFVTAALPSE